ncbi:putative short chain dehydrogenase/ reductase [Zalerion maritima]|uniref:Short chain dehydrogenase/ reductase n=1 Tax=Zalerion maritima TaxID=339359 RepID=A0AAD5RMN0_9PEZI|nr:putative short chain dehydrogenase/ reductase [Zalerion maritima]
MVKGKYFTVTGAASGIGRSTALILVQKGAAGISISDVNLQGLQETEKECKSINPSLHVHAAVVNVGNRSEVEAWISSAVSVFPGQTIDGCANVAGIAGGDGTVTIETIDQEDWDRTMKVNLTGILNCMRAQLPHVKRPGGSVLNVASTAGRRGLPHSAAYSTSKFAVIGLTETAAGEYGGRGVRINALLPGPVDTKIFRDGEAKGLFDSDMLSRLTLLGRMGKADEVAKVACFMLSDEASWVTGGKSVCFDTPRPSSVAEVSLTSHDAQLIGMWMGDFWRAEAAHELGWKCCCLQTGHNDALGISILLDMQA